MKNVKHSKKSEKTLDQLKSLLNNNQKLELKAMNSLRGGEGDDNGGEDVVIIPPKPVPVPNPAKP